MVGGDVEIIEVRVGDASSVAHRAKTLGDRAVDVLINNAGMFGRPPEQQYVQVMYFEGWTETFEVNAMAPVRVMQALIGNLKASDATKAVTITSQIGALSLERTLAMSLLETTGYREVTSCSGTVETTSTWAFSKAEMRTSATTSRFAATLLGMSP